MEIHVKEFIKRFIQLFDNNLSKARESVIRKKKIIVFVFIFILIGIIAIVCVGVANKKKDTKKIYQVSIEGIKVTDTIDTSINLSGKVKLNPNKKYNISLAYNAVIEDIYVEEGQKVVKDQELLLVKRYSDDNEFIIKANHTGNVSFDQDLAIGSSILQYSSIVTIYEITSVDDFYIEVPVLDSDFENINFESRAKVYFGNGLANIYLDGKISNDIPQIKEIDGSTYYIVKIKLQDEDSFLHNCQIAVNTPVTIKFVSNIEIEQDKLDEKQQYFIIPTYAIVVRNGQNAIFLYITTGKEEAFAKLVYVDVLYNYEDCTSAVKCNSNILSIDSRIITNSESELYGDESVIFNPNYQENLNLNLYQ